MRYSLALLAALAACSDSSAPHGLALTTQLSADTASVGGQVVVTLNVSNPTSTTLRQLYWAQTTYAEFIQGSSTHGGYSGGFTALDTLVLTSGANTTWGTVPVGITTSGVYVFMKSAAPAGLYGEEFVVLAPGSYLVRACIGVPPETPESFSPDCGNRVSFTVNP